jgi:hypothetical protein
MKYIAVLCLALLASPLTEARLIDWFIPGPVTLILKVGEWATDRNEDPVYYIQVEASGNDQIHARNTAFKLAVDQAVGSVISSESFVKNDSVNHELYNYSSGYVHNYKILSTSRRGNQTRVKVDVWVKPSAIADRVVHKTQKTNKLPGRTFEASLSTLQTENINGDQLLQSVLQDYPKRGFDMQFTESYLSNSRKPTLKLSWNLSWNQTYLQSLNEVLKTTGKEYGSSRVLWKNTRLHNGENYNYDDSRIALIQDAFVHPWNKYIITLEDKTGNALKMYCREFDDQKFVRGLYKNKIELNAWASVQETVKLNISDINTANLARYKVDIARSCN